MPSRSRNSCINARICAWIVTSSAVVGSSAMRMSGSLAIAIAIITRWRWPPRELVRIGVEPALGVAEADQVQQFEGAGARRRRRHVLVYQERLGDLLFQRVQRVQ